MDRRAFLEGLCASIAAAGLKASGEVAVPALAATTGPVLATEMQGSGQSSGAAAPSTASKSIAGEWRIRLDPKDAGIDDRWFHASDGFVDRIPLPGSTDEHQFGRTNDEIAPQHLTRIYEFTGPAWYERDIAIPESWQGKRVVLFLERCHWETRAWLDDYPLGVRNSLSTPHIYELGVVGKPALNRRSSELLPGTRRLTVRVDNRTKVDVGPSSSTTAEVGATWNGIIGRMELHVTDPVWIEGLSVHPHPQEKQIHVKLSMRNLTGKRSSG